MRTDNFTINLNIPSKLKFIFNAEKRFLIGAGGRGAGKSRNIATGLVIRSMMSGFAPCRIVCCRVVKDKIDVSVLALIKGAIDELGEWSQFFPRYHELSRRIKNDFGSEFLFQGLSGSNSSIRSLEGADILWIDEGQDLTQKMWDAITPTIRKKRSQIIVSMNTDVPSHLKDEFIDCDVHRNNVIVQRINYYDNDFFTETNLVEEMQFDKEHRPDRYRRVWLGEEVSDADTVVHAHWFKGYTDLNQILRRCTKYEFHADTANKDKIQHDWSVVGFWGFEGRKRAYLIDYIKIRVEIPDLEICVRDFYDKYAILIGSRPLLFVEDKQSGTALIQLCRRTSVIEGKVRRAVNARAWAPTKYGLKRNTKRLGAYDKRDDYSQKAARVDMCIPTFIRGGVWLPYYNEEVKKKTEEFIQQHKAFRRDESHKSDDIVDMGTMAIMRWIYRRAGGRVNGE